MVIGVISEDKNDCDALGVIIRRILGDKVFIVPACKFGKDAIIHQKKILVSKVFNFGCEVVFIVRDSDGGKLETILGSLKEAYDDTPIKEKYKICIAIQELESWFLGELDSVRLTYGLPANSSRIIETKVDNIINPKERLKSYIIKESHGKAQYIPSDTIRMAENIDIQKARTRSNSFDYFCSAIFELKLNLIK